MVKGGNWRWHYCQPRTQHSLEQQHISEGYKLNNKQCIFSYSNRRDNHAKHQMSRRSYDEESIFRTLLSNSIAIFHLKQKNTLFWTQRWEKEWLFQGSDGIEKATMSCLSHTNVFKCIEVSKLGFEKVRNQLYDSWSTFCKVNKKAKHILNAKHMVFIFHLDRCSFPLGMSDQTCIMNCSHCWCSG